MRVFSHFKCLILSVRSLAVRMLYLLAEAMTVKKTFMELENGTRFEMARPYQIGDSGPWVKASNKRYEHARIKTPEGIVVGFRVYVDFDVIAEEIPCAS